MNTLNQIYFIDFYNSLLDGDKQKCYDIVNFLLEDGHSILDIYVDLFQKSLYRIGKLWDQRELSISEEHMASNIISSLIERFSPEPSRKREEKVIVTCIDKEFHEIGAKMVTKVFELNGFNTFFLGANVPTKEILKFVRQIEPYFIAISWSLYLNLSRFLDVVDNLDKIFANKTIFVGGQALSENSDQLLKKFTNVKYIPTVKDLHQVLLNY